MRRSGGKDAPSDSMIQSCLVLPCSSGSLCDSFKEVEHPCQQCGTAVEDGRPFCPQCRAPQISVKVAIPETEVAAGLSSTRDAFSSEIPVGRSLASFETLPGATVGAMDRSIAARSAIKA